MDFNEFKNRFEFIKVEEYPHLVQNLPIVSVCIQTYNHEKYISRCIESVLEQEVMFEWEIIISEDESDDKTREICQKYAERYPEKIRLHLNSRKNNILVAGKATGNFTTLYNLFSAKGKYIAFCEGDDFWSDPLKLQKQFEFMESNPLYSVCYHNYQTVNSLGEVNFSNKASPLNKDLKASELMLSFIHPATLTVFFKSTVTEKIPVEITNVLAFDVFLFSLLGQMGPGKYLDSIQPACYRIHNGGLWTKMEIEPKLVSKINTLNQLSLYYSSIGKDGPARLFRERGKKIKLYLLFLSLKKFKPKLLLWSIKNL